MELGIWRQQGKLFFADKDKIQNQIKKCERSEVEIKRRMGFGYKSLEKVLNGEGVDGWQAQHIETGIVEDKVKIETHSWPPNHYEKGPF